jgi:hypothetical protein
MRLRSLEVSTRRTAPAACVLACIGALGGCGQSPSPLSQPHGGRHTLVFVNAPPRLTAACRATARIVGYPVPCPSRVPRGLTATGVTGASGCGLAIVGAGGLGACSKAWRGWVVGSSQVAQEHLVLSASPTALPDAEHAANGPAWYQKARVRLLRRMRINGWHVQAVFVPPASNDGSAFAQHVVLVWTAGRHTYAVGFHDVYGIAPTLALDTQLVRSIALVGPRR